jgi:serine/threonine protein kinase
VIPDLFRTLFVFTPLSSDIVSSTSTKLTRTHHISKAAMVAQNGTTSPPPPQKQAQVQPCRYKTGKTLGAGSYSVVKECVHIDTGRYYAAKVINKRLMAGREHMVSIDCRPCRSLREIKRRGTDCPVTGS